MNEKKLKCECDGCPIESSEMLITSAYIDGIKTKTRILCPRCHMAIALSMYQVSKKYDAKEARIIEEMANKFTEKNELLAKDIFEKHEANHE